MIVKNFIILSCFVGIIGCGVMSNPSNEKRIDDGIPEFTEVVSRISKIDMESLTVTDTNSVFVDGVGSMRISGLNAYKIFDTLESTQQFVSELNTSAQNLNDKDLITVESWIKNIKDANINYHTKNLLFYPLLQSEDCGLKESTTIRDNNVTILVQDSKDVCENVFVYHVLLYEVDKSIENIIVKEFSQMPITIANKK